MQSLDYIFRVQICGGKTDHIMGVDFRRQWFLRFILCLYPEKHVFQGSGTVDSQTIEESISMSFSEILQHTSF